MARRPKIRKLYKRVLRNFTMEVLLPFDVEFRFRSWLSVQLITLAAWVLGTGIEFVEHNEAVSAPSPAPKASKETPKRQPGYLGDVSGPGCDLDTV